MRRDQERGGCRGCPSVNRLQELAGPVLLRIGQNLFRRAGFDDAAAVEEAHRVGDLAGERHFVGGHHDGAPGRRQLADEGQHLADQFRVQRAGDLVEQQQSGFVGQRAGDGHPLLLAAGQFVGVGVGLVGQADAGQQLAAAFLGVAARRSVHHPRRQRDVGQRGHVGEQVERLEHHAHRLPGRIGVDARVADVAAVEQDLAVVDVLEQVDAPQQRRLSRPRRADQHHHLVLADVEVDTVEHRTDRDRP